MRETCIKITFITGKMHKVDLNDSSESKKSHHVRKLNFGLSILTLNTTKNTEGQKDGVLLLDKNLTDIPCTEKFGFVEKWIETHENYAFDSDNLSSSSSVSGASEDVQTSPVLYNQDNRSRKKSRPNGNVINESKSLRLKESENVIDKEKVNLSFENRKRMNYESERKRNVRRSLFSYSSFSSSDITGSPVLIKDSCPYKRKRRRNDTTDSQRKILSKIENEHIETSQSSSTISTKMYKLDESPVRDFYSCKENMRPVTPVKRKNNCVDLNMNPIIPKWTAISTETWFLLANKFEDFENFKSTPGKDLEVSKISVGTCSPTSTTGPDIEDSPKNEKDTAKIEIETINEDDNENEGATCISSNTDKHSTDNIEDIDTQSITPDISNRLPVPESSDLFSRLHNRSLDETFFSEAELSKRVFNVQPSQEIVQGSQEISQPSTAVKDNKSNAITISTEASQREQAEITMQLTLLDSGKKRKKPKKGSLVEKLQSVVNKQVSYVRMWRHQMKQKEETNIPAPCVTVHVQACIAHFGRQFLEGFVVEDLYDLLSCKEEIKTSAKSIKIMIIPDIVGKVEMKAQGFVQIFPPWETLDDKELTINVTYIRVVPDNETDVIQCDKHWNRKSIIKEYNCLCIDTCRMIRTCKDRLNKPNVMETLFM